MQLWWHPGLLGVQDVFPKGIKLCKRNAEHAANGVAVGLTQTSFWWLGLAAPASLSPTTAEGWQGRVSGALPCLHALPLLSHLLPGAARDVFLPLSAGPEEAVVGRPH